MSHIKDNKSAINKYFFLILALFYVKIFYTLFWQLYHEQNLENITALYIFGTDCIFVDVKKHFLSKQTLLKLYNYLVFWKNIFQINTKSSVKLSINSPLSYWRRLEKYFTWTASVLLSGFLFLHIISDSVHVTG